jgi:hypothetical protein
LIFFSRKAAFPGLEMSPMGAIADEHAFGPLPQGLLDPGCATGRADAEF